MDPRRNQRRKGRGLISPEELARRFAVTPETVRRWAHEGRLRPLRTPEGKILYRRAEVMPQLRVRGKQPAQILR